MKKIIIIIVILCFLTVTNILINSNSSELKKEMVLLSEAINLTDPASSFEITNRDKKLKLVQEESCYKIKSIDYCADDKKVKLLKKFLNNNIKDIYKNSEENINRLGFNSAGKSPSIIINESKTLFFGNINKYNEIYVLQDNKIYKVRYYKGLLDASTKQWIDKSKPIISLFENDKFDIEIQGCGILGGDIVAGDIAPISIEHKDLVSNQKYSILRNSFFDLYASDLRIMTHDELEVLYSKYKTLRIFLSPHTKNKKVDYYYHIWKEDHLVYLKPGNRLSNKAFIIPNSVYKNIGLHCKK